MTLAERVTLSVLTHDRAAELAITLGHLVRASEGAPLLVVDNASTDATAEVLSRFAPRARPIVLPDNRGAAGRNAGVRAATTPYVALCDDDTWWAPGALARAAAALDHHPEIAVVSARVLVGPAEREDPTSTLMAHSPLPRRHLPGPSVLGFLAGACMVRRVPFLAAGGFEPRFFLGGEERLLAVDLAAAGWSLIYLPEATVHHHPSPARDQPARRALLARNALWFAWMRRPLPRALLQTATLLLRACHDKAARGAARQALTGLPWALTRRRPLPADLERALALLDAD